MSVERPAAASPVDERGSMRKAAGKTALVLGGGGTLGAVQVGFIRRIEELGIPVDFLVGTSVGSLNAAHVAFHRGSSHDCLAQIWESLSGRRLFGRNPLAALRTLIKTRLSIFDNQIVRSLIEDHLAEDDFSSARVPLYVTATNLCKGRREILSEGSLATAILASTALPGLFPPVRIGDDLYADGGIAAGLDILAAVELGAETVIAIDLRPGLSPGCPRTIVDVLSRSLEIFGNARAACSIEHLDYGKTHVVHIQPGFTTGDLSSFEDSKRLIRESYDMACNVFESCWDGRTLRPGHYHPGGAETDPTPGR